MQKIVLHLAGAVAAALTFAYASSSDAAPGTVTYTYDDLGRLRNSSYSDGRLADYQYDDAGNRTTNTSGRAPSLAISPPSSPPIEGSPLSFTVTKTGVSITAVSVRCVQSDGSAKSGGVAPFDDYTPTSQVITFLPAEPSPATRLCTLTTKDDAFFEGNQTITGSLQDASAGTAIVTSSAVGVIADNDSPPVLSIAGSSKAESASPLIFSITKAGLTELDHNVTYSTEDGTASALDSDYTVVSGKHTFLSTNSSMTFNVPITNDVRFEPNETVAMRLSAPLNGATLGTSLAFSTITNDDQPPSISINNPAAVNEGALVTFTVTKLGSTAFSHSINWATANNSAVQPTDYTAASGVITFAAGETSKTLQVQSRTDGVMESGSETFFVNLTANAGTNSATFSDSQGVGTIADIDNTTPNVPTNLRVSPTGNTPNYSVLWSTPTGTVSYYQLEETYDGLARPPTNTTSTSVVYSNKSSGDYEYRVRACNASNVCSAYSGRVIRLVCNGPCQ